MPVNREVERLLDRVLSKIFEMEDLLPIGFHCETRLCRDNKRKRKDADFKKNWNPEKDSIKIVFYPAEEDGKDAPRASANPLATAPSIGGGLTERHARPTAFQPIPIRGETLSATVSRDRR